MPSEVVSEMILVIAVVLMGLLVFTFVETYLAPHIAFTMAQNNANNVAQSSVLSVGPLLVNSSTDTGSAVIMFNNPSMSGYVYVITFPAPSYLQPSVGILTPTSTPSFSVYLPNGTKASEVTITSPIYDVGGQTLYDSQIIAYQIPFNTPVTIKVKGVNANDILVIWVLYYTGGYWFRVSYTFTGVPS